MTETEFQKIIFPLTETIQKINAITGALICWEEGPDMDETRGLGHLLEGCVNELVQIERIVRNSQQTTS
jgi:hypothetical protein